MSCLPSDRVRYENFFLFDVSTPWKWNGLMISGLFFDEMIGVYSG